MLGTQMTRSFPQKVHHLVEEKNAEAGHSLKALATHETTPGFGRLRRKGGLSSPFREDCLPAADGESVSSVAMQVTAQGRECLD